MRQLVWIVISVLGLGCTPLHHEVEGDAGPPAVLPDVGMSATELIDASGGAVALGSVTLEVPPGALLEPVEITVRVVGDAVPESFTAFSPVLQFEPAGLQFAVPVTVRMPFDGDPDAATVFWTVGDTDAYAALDTVVEGSFALAETIHFSRAFTGTACSGPCCGRGRGELDVLLMIDNSNSMAEEQASLAAQIPRMAQVLATGDLDGDGRQDFPALRSIHVGTVSSDMGTAGFTVPTCADPMFGDDGVLQSAGHTDLMGCRTSYSPWADLSDMSSPTVVGEFVDQIRCTALLGTGGCGFEQPLESVLKAVTPSSAPLSFFNSSAGNADTENAGFLRTDSILATIVMTDENDCSAEDGDIFNPNSATYGATDLNLRCSRHESAALYDIERYVRGLRAARANPDDLIFAAIAGVPTDLAGQDPSVILADSRMQDVVDPMSPQRLLPSCDAAGRGVAFPPRRLVDLAGRLGASSTVQSICQDDFTPVIDAILTQTARRVSGACSM